MMQDREPTEWELHLAFYVNGTLDPEEAAQVRARLEKDPELQARAHILRELRDTVRSEAKALRGPGDFGLARLNRALDAEETPAPAPVEDRTRSRTLIWAAASAIAASLATVALIGPGNIPEPFYEQASGDPAALIVTFDPTVTVEEVSLLLRDAGLVIVDGPSALGLFRITPLHGETGSLDTIAASLETDARVLRVDISE